MRLKSLTLAISSLFVATSVFATDLSKETQTYKEFVVGQIDQLVTDTEKFVGYLKAGDVEKAKQIYITHIGSGLFACFAGVKDENDYLGKSLFEQL